MIDDTQYGPAFGQTTIYDLLSHSMFCIFISLNISINIYMNIYAYICVYIYSI